MRERGTLLSEAVIELLRAQLRMKPISNESTKTTNLTAVKMNLMKFLFILGFSSIYRKFRGRKTLLTFL